ncbi:Terpenoid synthase [Pseudocohnilembus persalinus]|uniref:Terpenoid synthase n=1 Tax=Pseudocohnilembus persalinus TaxID=266149 RepID=A0A0V0QMT6_PSEPJ|nr:Terpenoid synthase [Pseudocohnilembus persalinus]|eukprot:KRX03566.1 Terpenoid synthase [Pseudocohnilembus persalinus]
MIVLNQISKLITQKKDIKILNLCKQQKFSFSDKPHFNEDQQKLYEKYEKEHKQSEENLKKIEEEYNKFKQEYENKTIYDTETAQKYVVDNIKKFDWNSYIIGPYYPSAIRNDFYTLQYYNLELMRIPESTREPSLALGKLEFWDDSLDHIFSDNPIKEPLSLAIHHTCKNNPLSKRQFQYLVQARRIEIENKHVPDLPFLVNLAETIRGNLIKLNLQLLRVDYRKNPELQKCIILVARCLGLLDYIKRIPFTLQKYRLYMPDDLLRKHNVSVRNLWDRIEGKPKDELFDVVLEVAAFAKKCLEEAKQYNSALPPQAFRAMLHAVEAEYYLEYLEKVNFNVFDRGINSSSYIQLPYRVFVAAKSQQFYTNK